MTTIELSNRRGQTFFHRDTRLRRGYPTIMHSVDVSSVFSTARRPRLVTLDYARDGGRKLVVEISVYRPSDFIFWSHAWFPVDRLWRPDDPRLEYLPILSERLGRSPREIAATILAHAPGQAPRRRFIPILGTFPRVAN